MSIDRYRSEVLKLSLEGKTTREIASWLEAKGESTSHISISRWLRKQKEERAVITQEVLAQELPKVLTADLQRLEDIYADLEEKASSVAASWNAESKADVPLKLFSGRVADWCKIKDLQLKTIALRLSHAGATAGSGDAPRAVPVVVLPRGVSFEEWDKIWAKLKK